MIQRRCLLSPQESRLRRAVEQGDPINRGQANINMRLIGAGGDEIGSASRAARALRRMSPEQFLQLGVNQVAYVLAGLNDGEPCFLILGADAAPLAILEDLEEAEQMSAEWALASPQFIERSSAVSMIAAMTERRKDTGRRRLGIRLA